MIGLACTRPRKRRSCGQRNGRSAPGRRWSRPGALPACHRAQQTASLRARSMNLGNIAIALCALILAPLGQAQTPPPPLGGSDELSGKFSDMPMDIVAEKFDASGILAVASGN